MMLSDAVKLTLQESISTARLGDGRLTTLDTGGGGAKWGSSFHRRLLRVLSLAV